MSWWQLALAVCACYGCVCKPVDSKMSQEVNKTRSAQSEGKMKAIAHTLANEHKSLVINLQNAKEINVWKCAVLAEMSFFGLTYVVPPSSWR